MNPHIQLPGRRLRAALAQAAARHFAQIGESSVQIAPDARIEEDLPVLAAASQINLPVLRLEERGPGVTEIGEAAVNHVHAPQTVGLLDKDRDTVRPRPLVLEISQTAFRQTLRPGLPHMLAFARNQIRQAVLVQIEKDRRRKTVQGHVQEIGIQKNRPTQGFPHAGILYPEKPETSVFHAQHHLVLPVPIQITKARIQSPQSPFGKPKKIIRNQFKSWLARRADIPQQGQRRNHHRVPIAQFVISPRFPAIIAHHQISQPVVVVIVSHRISPRPEIQHPVLQEILLQQAAPSRSETRLGITPDALRAFGIERVCLVRRQQVA